MTHAHHTVRIGRPPSTRPDRGPQDRGLHKLGRRKDTVAIVEGDPHTVGAKPTMSGRPSPVTSTMNLGNSPPQLIPLLPMIVSHIWGTTACGHPNWPAKAQAVNRDRTGQRNTEIFSQGCPWP
jgi:hypothetical protein